MAQGSEAPFSGGKEPPPPTWDGSEPGLDLANFEKNVRLWEYESELDPTKRGVRLLRNLTGVARAVGDTLEFEDIACQKGVANLMAALKAHFAPHLEVSMPRAFERAIYGQPRSHKETMQEYLIRVERSFHLLEKEKVKVPDEAMGYVTYRQAALTESQDLKFTTWSNGKFDYKTVAACLRKLEKVIPEHKLKGQSSAFVQENEMDDAGTGMDTDGDWIDPDLLADESGQWILIEEGDTDQVWEEAEVQVALATYQEVRKAINAHQKGRQYYGGKGESRGSMGYKSYMKGKKKIRIEELKLRTKCGRCGLVGHWAKECKNAPDQRGRAAMHAAQTPSSTSGASQPASSYGGSQQSWYVAAGSSCSSVVCSSTFCNIQCEGYNTDEGHKVGGIFADKDTDVDGPRLRGLGVFEKSLISSDRIRPLVVSSTALFVGLTTNPSMAVVDTAAQDGLIGSLALERLKEQLAAFGLRVVWTGRQAKAHGVGGAAKVLGIVAIPLGLAKSSGVLEATVVEGEVPLLLPIKLLKQLQAVIDVDEMILFFRRLGKSMPLFPLPSGHVAIEIFDFGTAGFSCPSNNAGYSDCDFRISCGPMPNQGDVMLSQASSTVFHSTGHGSSLKVPSGFRRSPESRNTPRSWSAAQSKECHEELAHYARQGVSAARAGWFRSLGELVVAGHAGEFGPEIFSAILGTARRHCRAGREASSFEVEVDPVKGDGELHPCQGEVDNRSEPACSLGDMCRLPLQVESSEQSTAHQTVQDGGEASFELKRGVPVCGVQGDHALERRVGAAGCRTTVNSCGSAGVAPEGADGDPVKESPDEAARSDEDGICQYGIGAGVSSTCSLPRRRDVHLCREPPGLSGGDATAGRPADASQCGNCRDGEATSHRFSSIPECFLEGTCEKGRKTPQQSTWVRLMRPLDLRKKVEKMRQSGHVEVLGVFAAQSEHMVKIEDEAELEFEDECLVLVQQTLRGRMEDEVEEVAETALPRKLKKQLRKAFNYTSENFPVAMSEVYSQPRISVEAKKKQLSTGGAYDLHTGFDLRLKRDLEKMWSELLRDDPELVTCSPPCRPFSMLQELNFPKMVAEIVIELVGEGLHHVRTSIQVCTWQYERRKLFLFEHPLTSKVWEEPEMQELQQLPGVFTCDLDMCMFGLNVDGKGLNRKPTRVVVNSEAIATEIHRRCNGSHSHESLMGGKAAKAAHYTPAFCRAVVRGLQHHLRERYGQHHSFVSEAEITVLAADEEAELFGPDPLEEEEAVHEDGVLAVPEDGVLAVPERESVQRLEEAVNKDDEAKIRRLHVNLGHPAKPSFLRFLKAGRVREEILKWVRQSFTCDTCESQKIPKAPRPAIVPKCYAPGVAVGLDVFYIPDLVNRRSIPVLNLVDLGTNYQMIEVLESKEPMHIWHTFWQIWARTFGLPQYMTIDEGREFRGGFAQLCANVGTVVFRTAARSPWQNGRVERHGGVMKDMIEKSRSELPPSTMMELKQILYACESAKNRFSNRSGFSPTQRQIGHWPRLPSSLMSDEELDPALQAQNGSDDFLRLMEMRRVAQEAFVKVASQEAAAKALKARPRVSRSFKAGEVVYVFRSLRRKKTVRGDQTAPRGDGLGRKATWVGPGHVLAVEGSVIWVNMFGELWRAAVEQVRGATSMEKLGVEMISEEFEEMQERLKRSSHRAGYRDLTKEPLPEIQDESESLAQPGLPELQDEDEVAAEGIARGIPRARLDNELEEDDYEPSILGGQELEQLRQSRQNAGERQVSERTEPEGEIPASSPLASPDVDLQVPSEELCDQMVRSFEANRRLDGLPPEGYDASRRAIRAAWRGRVEQPYFNEIEVFFEDEKEEVSESSKCTKDYWVFDQHRLVLQRHHVVWRKAFFNPVQAEGSPVPFRALRKGRTTQRVTASGQNETIEDEWSLFTKKEEKKDWWKGITEFQVDGHYLQQGEALNKRKRGEGEVFPHEIEKEEWPEWQVQDRAEFEKVVSSGALRVLSLEESRAVTRRLKAEGKLNRVLPSCMVRRYKPGDQPGAPRSKKSRFCIRGDRDPDAIFLSRFAPTVTTSNLQVFIQAAVNRRFRGQIGDLKSAFTQSMPLVRENGPLYCKSCFGSMPDLHEEQICEIVLGCYGLVDAPLHWRKTLISYLTEELGYKQSALDPCTFLLHGEKGLHGMIAVEVDDLLMFGDGVHEEKMSKLQERFTFGKIVDLNAEGSSFNGRRLRKIGDEVHIDMKAFVEERLQPVKLDPERAKLKKEAITEEERTMVRSTCGSLNWAGREGRPDAAAAASMFSSQMMEMKVEDILELNKVVAALKKDSDMTLRIQPIEEAQMRWGVFCDASWANAKNGKTQAGHMLVVFDKDLLEGKQAKMNLLHWKSGKLHRTVNSTLAAETQSLARGVGDLLWMMVMYLEMVKPEFQLRDWRRYVGEHGYTAFTANEDPEDLVQAVAVVDAKSLYDLLINETTGGSDRRNALDVQVLREELKSLYGKIRWIEHMEMPADCLTKKQGRVDTLYRLLREGRFGITAESKTLADRLIARKEHGYNRR